MKACLAFAFLSIVSAASAFSQTPGASWTGQAQCQLSIQSQGFVHQEIQTWILTGGLPTQQGAIQIYPAVWKVTGQGDAQLPQGAQVMASQWASNVPGMNAPLALFVRASDNRLIIKSWHAQLGAPNATVASRKVGGSQASTTAAVYEWQFPMIEDAPTNTNVSGTGTIMGTANKIAIPGVNATGIANCKWQFSKGGNSGTTANTIGDEQAATNHRVIQDYSTSLQQSWTNQRPGPGSPTPQGISITNQPPQTVATTGTLSKAPAQAALPANQSSSTTVNAGASPAVHSAPEGTGTSTTAPGSTQTPIHPGSAVRRTTATSGSNSGSNTNLPTEAGHTLSTASQLPDVKGDSGSDVDTRVSSWSSAPQDDFYEFSLARSTQALSRPPLTATITVSGLQSATDFDAMIYNVQGRSFATGPFSKVTHTGATSLVTCITENSLNDAALPPNLVVVLHSRSAGPYTLTVTGNRGTGCSTIPTDIQTPTYAPFSPAPLSAGHISGNAGTGAITQTGSSGSGNQDVYYDFQLVDDVGGAFPPQMKAMITISGLQPGADFDATVYTTQYGSNTPYGKVSHTGSDPLVFCVTADVNIQKATITDVVVGLHSRAAGPYQLTIAGNTTQGCAGAVSLPAM